MNNNTELQAISTMLAPAMKEAADSCRGASIIDHGKCQVVFWKCNGNTTYSFIRDVVAAKPDAKNWPQSYFTLVGIDGREVGRFLAKGCSGSCGSVFLREYFSGRAKLVQST